MRLGVSAVQHDMKREETVEEVEKNTEWQRRTPKRGVGGSNPLWDAICTAFAVLFLCAKNFRFLFICSVFLLIGNELVFEIC